MEMRWTFGRAIASAAIMLVAGACAVVGIATALLRPRPRS